MRVPGPLRQPANNAKLRSIAQKLTLKRISADVFLRFATISGGNSPIICPSTPTNRGGSCRQAASTPERVPSVGVKNFDTPLDGRAGVAGALVACVEDRSPQHGPSRKRHQPPRLLLRALGRRLLSCGVTSDQCRRHLGPRGAFGAPPQSSVRSGVSLNVSGSCLAPADPSARDSPLPTIGIGRGGTQDPEAGAAASRHCDQCRSRQKRCRRPRDQGVGLTRRQEGVTPTIGANPTFSRSVTHDSRRPN